MARFEPQVRQISGASRIQAALRSGSSVRLILVQRGALDPEVPALIEQAAGLGIRVREVSASVLRRVSDGNPGAEILALAGRGPGADLGELLGGAGAVWLLVGVAYPSNAGMAIRTAEVSGADGIIIDAAFNAAARRFALRCSVRSDWYMPVLWEPAERVVEAAAAAGRDIIGVEHVGTAAPWEIDLTGRVLLIVGGEARGIPEDVLTRCQRTVRIPVAGFIPSYNVQAAIAAIAVERLRQFHTRA